MKYWSGVQTLTIILTMANTEIKNVFSSSNREKDNHQLGEKICHLQSNNFIFKRYKHLLHFTQFIYYLMLLFQSLRTQEQIFRQSWTMQRRGSSWL